MRSLGLSLESQSRCVDQRMATSEIIPESCRLPMDMSPVLRTVAAFDGLLRMSTSPHLQESSSQPVEFLHHAATIAGPNHHLQPRRD